jgi:S-DNA-T family DNA segregation ATPase FtsK/SpoIIIE
MLDRLAAARKATYDRDPAVQSAAVRDLLDLATAPGGDALEAVLVLADFDRPFTDAAVREQSRAAIAAIVGTVPSPDWPAQWEAPPALGVDQLWGIADPPAFDPTAWWRRPDRLGVAIGTAPDGRTVRLDLREAAAGGHGPHVLVVGATGSGKTELLRTVVLGLAAANSPDDVNLLLVDHFGTASFAGLEALPHVAGFARNLVGEPGETARLAGVIGAELLRRQELFRAAGPVADIADYRRTGRPLPSLVIVAEDLTELLVDDPRFLDLLTTVGRVGRPLGVHLVLASQRHVEDRLRGLGAHLACRIALRTFSTAESREVLGVPDAYHLPAAPGFGLLRTGPAAPLPFRAAYASGAYRRPGPPTWDEVLREARSFGRSTVLDTLVGRIAQHGVRARTLWPPAEPDGERP